MKVVNDVDWKLNRVMEFFLTFVAHWKFWNIMMNIMHFQKLMPLIKIVLAGAYITLVSM